MSCRCCKNNNSQNNMVSDTSYFSSNETANERCSGDSFWPEFANLPRNVSSNSSDNVYCCCGRCSRR